MERVILDTSAVIAVERNLTARDAITSRDQAISSITAAELLMGVELADDAHRESRRRSCEAVFEGLLVIPFDLEVARVHAALAAHTRRTGTPRGDHDLQIAATARATGRTVITANVRHFEDLPGVSCLQLPLRPS